MSESHGNPARERILEGLRLARPRGGSAALKAAAPNVAASVSAAGTHQAPQQQRQLAARLAEALLASHAEVLHLREDEWPQTLAALAQAEQLQNWLCHPGCEAGGIFSSFVEGAGLKHLHLRRYPLAGQARPDSRKAADALPSKAALFHDIDAGLSHAVAGIAETGTLLLFSSPSQPRLLSLVPPVHAVTLRYSAIQATMAECMARNAVFHKRPLPANILFISGPSKTADIQQTLAYGAHGPKRLIVILIDDLADLSSTSS